MVWLRGGPFLEVSFILEEKRSMKESVIDFIDNLSCSIFKVKSQNINNLIDKYCEGYPFDREDSNSCIIHTMSLYNIIKPWPDVGYAYTNFSIEYALKHSSNLFAIIWNKEIGNADYKKYESKLINKNGVLVFQCKQNEGEGHIT